MKWTNSLHLASWGLIFFALGTRCVLAIVRGTVVSEEQRTREFPFSISITKNGLVHCSGTLLSKQWTLTACRCLGVFIQNSGQRVFSTYNYETIVLIGGSVVNIVTVENYDRIQLRIPIEAKHHPKCENKTWLWRNDYGAYKTEPFEITPHLKPARFIPQNQLKEMLLLWIAVEAKCVTIGWGMTRIVFYEHYSEPSNTLLMAQVHLLDWDDCGLELCQPPVRFCDEKIYKLGKLCAGPINGSDNCEKDEGGTLLCGEQTIIGFMSRSTCCGEYRKPTVYSSIIKDSGFINEILRSSAPIIFTQGLGVLLVWCMILRR